MRRPDLGALNAVTHCERDDSRGQVSKTAGILRQLPALRLRVRWALAAEMLPRDIEPTKCLLTQRPEWFLADGVQLFEVNRDFDRFLLFKERFRIHAQPSSHEGRD